MKTVSLLGVASYFPEAVVTNDFFAPGTAERRGMFTAPESRRHVAPGETASSMIERAARRLCEQLALDPARDIDLLFTNVTIPDQPFSGCGAEVAAALGAHPRWVIDFHNSGCVSFIYMMEVAQTIIDATDARGALLCNVQNAAGRVFAHPEVRLSSQAPVPGDGCGVGFIAPSDRSPILSIVHRCHGEFARDMTVSAADGRHYWEPGPSPITVAFTDERVAAIVSRGNRMVPEIVRLACARVGLRSNQIDLLVTNQPNPIFLRNWREALELLPEAHHDTYARYGNLFGAAIPINIEDALVRGKLRAGQVLALGGFSHAGDYTAAALIRWQAGRKPSS